MFLHLQAEKRKMAGFEIHFILTVNNHPISKELLTIIIWAGAPYRKSNPSHLAYALALASVISYDCK
jgi:hypothetical protein